MPPVVIENPRSRAGITIRAWLDLLRPADDENYRLLDIMPRERPPELGSARVGTNFHAIKLRKNGDASRLTKRVLAAAPGAFTESTNKSGAAR